MWLLPFRLPVNCHANSLLFACTLPACFSPSLSLPLADLHEPGGGRESDQTGHRGCSLRTQQHSAMDDPMQQDQGCAAVSAAGAAPAGLPTCICPSCNTTPRWFRMLRLGPGIYGLSLSPTQELLATTHANRRGIYLWANQLIFGHGATDLAPSDVPVDAELPLLGAGNKGLQAHKQKPHRSHRSRLVCGTGTAACTPLA